jgi:hypothetical protein
VSDINPKREGKQRGKAGLASAAFQFLGLGTASGLDSSVELSSVSDSSGSGSTF